MKAEIQKFYYRVDWMPAFAVMTKAHSDPSVILYFTILHYSLRAVGSTSRRPTLHKYVEQNRVMESPLPGANQCLVLWARILYLGDDDYKTE